MRVRVKICGVTRTGDVLAAIEAGADAIGFVFADSPRRVSVDQARSLAERIPPTVYRVAVFRHPDPRDVEDVVRQLRPDAVQAEPSPALERALPEGTDLLPVFHDGPDVVERVAAGRAAIVHLEAAGRGGRGIAPDRSRAAAVARACKLILAGGLDPENVAGAIARVRPFAVDVSSGVEKARGVKDPGRIRAFVAAVRRAERVLAVAEVRDG